MRHRLFSVLVVFVLSIVMVAPGAVMAAPSTRSVSTPDAPLLLEWSQRNASGFGDKDNHAVSSLEVFRGQLYAGTTNDLGAQLWRTADGTTWSRVVSQDFSGGGNGVLFDMIVFDGRLYAGFGAWPVHGAAGEIWRTADGDTWEKVRGAWDTNANNAGVNNFAFFAGMLYATTYNPVEGIQIYRSSTGKSTEWTQVASGSFGHNSSYGNAPGLAAFNNALYVALEGQPGSAGTRIYRSSDGTTWAPVNAPGFGDMANYGAGGFGIHNGFLYLGTRNDSTGGQIWRSQDGTSWAQVATSGFGLRANYKIEGFVSALGTLFAFADNDSGAQVWQSRDGISWEQSNVAGFGSANNKAVALWSNSSGLLGGQLFLGTFNQAVGGEIWSATPPAPPAMNHKIFLPWVGKR